MIGQGWALVVGDAAIFIGAFLLGALFAEWRRRRV